MLSQRIWTNFFYAHQVAQESHREGRLQWIDEIEKEEWRWMVFDDEEHFLGVIDDHEELWALDLAHCYAYQPATKLIKESTSKVTRVKATKRHAICNNTTVPCAIRKQLSSEWLYFPIPKRFR